jgi:hypothetical protein
MELYEKLESKEDVQAEVKDIKIQNSLYNSNDRRIEYAFV